MGGEKGGEYFTVVFEEGKALSQKKKGLKAKTKIVHSILEGRHNYNNASYSIIQGRYSTVGGPCDGRSCLT